VQQVAVSKREDLWILGNHRLFCGDGTTASNVARLLDKVKPNLMVTDPPYGVDYDPNWRNEADRANGKPYGARAVGLVSNDHRADWSAAWKLFSGNIAYVWHGGLHTATVARSLQNCGFVLRAQIIWSKNNFAISRGDYHWKHEPCWYAVRGKGNWAGDRSQTTVWNIDKPLKSDTGHSTQKPVECMRRPMQNNSNGDQVVYEPFCGSGSTIIAAEQLGRRCYALEIEPLYCDVIIKRWQDFTGQKATLQGDKRTFSEIADARQKPKTSRRSA
jgi:DNA modification methylase